MCIYTYYPWRRDRLPTSVFSCLENPEHGQRSLVGYSPRGCKESDTTELPSTECTHTHTHTHTHAHIYMNYPQEVPPCTPPNHNPSLPPKEQWMFLWSGWQVSPWSRRGWTRMWWECHQPLGSSTSLCKFGYNFNFFAFKRIILPPKRVSLDTIV